MHIFIIVNSGSMRQGDRFSQTKKKSEKPVIDIIDFNSGSMRQGDHFSQTKKNSEKTVNDIIDFK